MEQPLVSVITITRNRGNLIRRCIDSVLNQTYHNIEHIVVDGASTDDTEIICCQYEEKDPRFHYLRLEQNEPIPETIYMGFERSKGAFITFLDDDDEYLPDKIQKQVELFLGLPSDYGMVYCWMTYFDSETGAVLRVHCPKLKGDVYEDVVKSPTLTGTPTYMIRRDVFAKSGGWRNRGIVSDWELAIRICKEYKVNFVAESLINIYENHSSQRMSDQGYYSNVADKYVVFYEYLLKEHEKYFDENPKAKVFHLTNLAKMYLIKRDFEHFWKRYKELIKLEPSFKNITLPPRYFIKSLTKRNV